MRKLFVALLIVPLLSFSVHKYYIALTEIEYKEETQSVQMIMNVFMDDIETAINQDFDVDLQLSTKKELKNSDKYFLKYLKEHFKIFINNQKLDYNFIGKEYDGNIVYFYLEIDSISSVKSIEIQNDILIKYFPEQQNLIKASIKKDRKSLFLTKKNDKGLLKF